jgi:hypothetical protein
MEMSLSSCTKKAERLAFMQTFMQNASELPKVLARKCALLANRVRQLLKHLSNLPRLPKGDK